MRHSKWILAVALTLASFLSGCRNQDEVKRDQYYAEGYQLYMTYCANCHQSDGSGMASLYPPLKGSEFLTRKEQFICISKNGLSGEIQVGGKIYNRPMPANPKLTDIELAEIVTYVYNTWGDETSYTPIDSVTQALDRCEPPR
jgi:mono/diheme cytochrome c family protein